MLWVEDRFRAWEPDADSIDRCCGVGGRVLPRSAATTSSFEWVLMCKERFVAESPVAVMRAKHIGHSACSFMMDVDIMIQKWFELLSGSSVFILRSDNPKSIGIYILSYVEDGINQVIYLSIIIISSLPVWIENIFLAYLRYILSFYVSILTLNYHNNVPSTYNCQNFSPFW